MVRRRIICCNVAILVMVGMATNSVCAKVAATASVPCTKTPADSSSGVTATTVKRRTTPPKDKNFRPAQIGQVIFVLNDPSLLRHRLPKLVFHQQTLAEILNEFSVLTNTNVAAGWAAMTQAGMQASRRLTLRLPGQGYKLDLVAALKAFAPRVRMVISADQNVIFVNTQAADNQHLIMRTYWLPDLIANIPRYVNPNSFHRGKNNITSVPQTPKDASDVNSAPGRGNKIHPQTNIIQIITNHVEPKIWANHGGKATISQVGNKVIVIAPASVQALLQGPSHYNPNAVPLFMTVSY